MDDRAAMEAPADTRASIDAPVDARTSIAAPVDARTSIAAPVDARTSIAAPVDTRTSIAALGAWFDAQAGVAVAVSGGIDSLTLSAVAGRRPGARAGMYHAVSPAVPPEATARVRELAAREGWNLHIVDANEFGREEYVANPVNRCFYCKQSLYEVVGRHTQAQVVSGANTDDLGEYRPGLDAARDAGVRHPFIELGIGKAAIRRIARVLGLGELSELPASPCLSSRIETGIGITPEMLARVHAAERAVSARLHAAAVRCRIRGEGVVIEVDAATLAAVGEGLRALIVADLQEIFPLGTAAPTFAPYRNGSAFLVKRDDRARHPA